MYVSVSTALCPGIIMSCCLLSSVSLLVSVYLCVSTLAAPRHSPFTSRVPVIIGVRGADREGVWKRLLHILKHLHFDLSLRNYLDSDPDWFSIHFFLLFPPHRESQLLEKIKRNIFQSSFTQLCNFRASEQDFIRGSRSTGKRRDKKKCVWGGEEKVVKEATTAAEI